MSNDIYLHLLYNNQILYNITIYIKLYVMLCYKILKSLKCYKQYNWNKL